MVVCGGLAQNKSFLYLVPIVTHSEGYTCMESLPWPVDMIGC
jgi:hypothetical protein